ncbi:uncharacterized protein LOC115769380 [Drosophila novamexicana]|uniref:uncharacterized protein LOC115769380 n=1 Tax=Drosophila novamexicana TaxID=47314 RepID=UPI0011E5C9D5|nr:uncharacterized protein LOC115769380 [Drosophila novamexicana]XP_030570036.1 uncharacterized protein LOC115769380 [Drosophila novamexicana]
MNKLRTWLPGQHAKDSARHSVTLEPEIGFQITIEMHDQKEDNQQSFTAANGSSPMPELNVHLIAARHLPSLFGFKIVQGYLIKVKLFPGTKRLDSSIQTNTWPKFNENFKFPLVPDIKPSLKHGSAFSSRRQVQSRTAGDFSAPDELFAGQFVVFTVYALLELPAASFNRFNKTYRSLKDKSSSFVQRLSAGETQTENGSAQKNGKNKKTTENPRDAMPPLTISESRRNIGSVTCYLEPKLFKRNARTGCYATEELWLPIKDITTTVLKTMPSNNNNNTNGNNLTNAPKGVVELALELRDLSENEPPEEAQPEPKDEPAAAGANNWQRMTAEVKRKMGISNVTNVLGGTLVLRVTTARMRCSNKVKDELEATASAGVYVKTTVFEHGIYVDAWKSPIFYPSLSTKWDGAGGDEATICVPLRSREQLENIVIRITLATKLKMGKKLVLGTVLVGGGDASATESGMEQMRLLRDAPLNERVATWHCYH